MTIMKENIRNTVLLALMGVAIGVAGIIGYYQHIKWLFYTCTVLCLVQLLLNLFLKALQDQMYPYLVACLLTGYFLTGNVLSGLCMGVCLHYATALIYVCIPIQLSLVVVPIVSIVAFFLHAEKLFMVTAVYCTLYFFIKHFQGKLPAIAMDMLLWSCAFGVGFLQWRDTDTYQSVKIIKGVLWGGSAYYIVSLFYVWYHLYVKHDSIPEQ